MKAAGLKSYASAHRSALTSVATTAGHGAAMAVLANMKVLHVCLIGAGRGGGCCKPRARCFALGRPRHHPFVRNNNGCDNWQTYIPAVL